LKRTKKIILDSRVLIHKKNGTRIPISKQPGTA
jgi:hypothetical protein